MLSNPPTAAELAPIRDELTRLRPDILLVGLGSPKQELWIDRTAARLSPAVQIGVGASLDFLAGKVRRAPAWMQRAGLEWLYRLAQEPRRLWRRYLINDPKFLLVLARTLREANAVRIGA
jgi:N-acetylglucosaminyldiphosphoundecaprenol N-acetyl-beta-D-mannosaminyltransferase